MGRKVYAGRYAQAAFEIALESKELDKWQSDLNKMSGLGEDEGLITAMENPKYPIKDKIKVLSERIGDIGPLALNMACLLVTKGKLNMISEISSEYQRLLNAYKGIAPAEIITAIELDDADKNKLSEHLSTMTGKKVILEPKTDTNVIGGVIARIGGKLIDGSTRSQLQALKNELSGARG